MKRNRSLVLLGGLLIATVFFHQVCQSETTAPAPAGGAPAAAPVAAGGGTIQGKAAFTGTPPVMGKLRREADPFCGKTVMMDEEVVVNPNGTLKNVLIRISSGAAPLAMPPATPVLVDQNNCMYRPRIVGGVVGQKLLIKNSDPVMHNVHTYAGPATLFNQAQPKGAKDIEKTISAGVSKFKCDVHPWMTGYVVGSDNPYFCITNETGACPLSGVPPGTYTVEAWHEKYGAKTATVTVAAGQAAAADFSFGP